MSEIHSTERVRGDARRKDASRGMALVTTLLLLTVMMAMTLAMVIAVTSDTLITKYYRNARASFYAADSGVNIARQAMLSSLSGAALVDGQTFTTGTLPTLSSSDVSTALAAVNSAYASKSSILGGAAANSWPSSFQIVGSQSGMLGTTLAGCVMGAGSCTPTTPFCSIGTVVGATNAGPYTCTNPPSCTGTCTSFSAVVNYSFPYTITAIGQSIANEQQIVEDAGSLVVTATFDNSAAFKQSFAAWGMFIDQYPECSGSTLVPGTISGPVFTNGAWTFGNSGSYTFTGKVGSVSSTFGWQGGSCTESATYPQPGFSTTFQSTVSLGANAVPLPANDFNQKEAVVDGLGNQGRRNGCPNEFRPENDLWDGVSVHRYDKSWRVYALHEHVLDELSTSAVHDWRRHLRGGQCQQRGTVGGHSYHQRGRAQPASVHDHPGYFAGHDDHDHRRSHEQHDDDGLADRLRCGHYNHDQRRARQSFWRDAFSGDDALCRREHQFDFGPLVGSGHCQRISRDRGRRKRQQHDDYGESDLRDRARHADTKPNSRHSGGHPHPWQQLRSGARPFHRRRQYPNGSSHIGPEPGNRCFDRHDRERRKWRPGEYGKLHQQSDNRRRTHSEHHSEHWCDHPKCLF